MNEYALSCLQVLHPLPGIPHSKNKMFLAFWTHLLEKDFLFHCGWNNQRGKDSTKFFSIFFSLEEKGFKRDGLSSLQTSSEIGCCSHRKESTVASQSTCSGHCQTYHENMTGQQIPGYLKQQMQEQKQDSATCDTGNWGTAVGIRVSHSRTAWWKSNTVPPREVCSQGTPIFGTALLQKASNRKYGNNIQYRGTNKTQLKPSKLQVKMK